MTKRDVKSPREIFALKKSRKVLMIYDLISIIVVLALIISDSIAKGVVEIAPVVIVSLVIFIMHFFLAFLLIDVYRRQYDLEDSKRFVENYLYYDREVEVIPITASTMIKEFVVEYLPTVARFYAVRDFIMDSIRGEVKGVKVYIVFRDGDKSERLYFTFVEAELFTEYFEIKK